MYNHSAIMTTAHRDYESRVATVRAFAEKRKASVADALRALWRTCLRSAWSTAKDAVRWAKPIAPVSEAQKITDMIADEETKDRGYDFGLVARLHAHLLTIQARAA